MGGDNTALGRKIGRRGKMTVKGAFKQVLEHDTRFQCRYTEAKRGEAGKRDPDKI